ncbi:MAG: hypothetical protein ACOC5T_03895 [Elusimicrobiota bacterium]
MNKQTLSDKEMTWHEEAIFYDGRMFKEDIPLSNGDTIFRGKDVKEFIKELKKEILSKAISNSIENALMNENESEISLISLSEIETIIDEKAGERFK